VYSNQVKIPKKCVFITAVPITKLFARGGGGNGGHVLRETTSRGRCELVCPSRGGGRGGHCDVMNTGEKNVFNKTLKPNQSPSISVAAHQKHFSQLLDRKVFP
jgi:hypothetical protein